MRRLIFVVLSMLAAACGSDDDKTAAAERQCGACKANEICVQSFDGTCNLSASCQPLTTACPDRACATACATYCGARPVCDTAPCGAEVTGAVHCYGP